MNPDRFEEDFPSLVDKRADKRATVQFNCICGCKSEVEHGDWINKKDIQENCKDNQKIRETLNHWLQTEKGLLKQIKKELRL